MPTTTNYGWTTPADTDLVKDGAAAIRTLGSSIDTTVFNNANAAIAKTIVDAKGDIIAATAADTVARLAVGANDTVLTADSSTATGLKWAAPASGGMTLLSTTSLSGATTTISGISGAYTNLYALIYGVSNATADGTFRCAPNGTTNITTTWEIGAQGGAQNWPDDYLFLSRGNSLYTNTSNVYALTIYNYSSTTAEKPLQVSGYYYVTFYSARRAFAAFGGINTTSAITSLVFSNTGGDLSTGTVLLYGVK